jgi:hypothetical protein
MEERIREGEKIRWSRDTRHRKEADDEREAFPRGINSIFLTITVIIGLEGAGK